MEKATQRSVSEMLETPWATAFLAAQPRRYAHRAHSRAVVAAPPETVFALLDDHRRLARHMAVRSWRMGWGKMNVALDPASGRSVGSRILLGGRVLGVRLFVEERVVQRAPPTLKAWEVVGEPTLLVIGPYRMAFRITPDPDVAWSHLTVWIDYDLPSRGAAGLWGRWLGHWYARWCTRRMVEDARSRFAEWKTPFPRMENAHVEA